MNLFDNLAAILEPTNNNQMLNYIKDGETDAVVVSVPIKKKLTVSSNGGPDHFIKIEGIEIY